MKMDALTLSQVDQLEMFAKEHHICCPKHPGDNEYQRLQSLQGAIIRSRAAGHECQVLCETAMELITQRRQY